MMDKPLLITLSLMNIMFCSNMFVLHQNYNIINLANYKTANGVTAIKIKEFLCKWEIRG